MQVESISSTTDGPRNCEAAAVNPQTNECWLIEKVYYDSKQTEPPGIFVLPFLQPQDGPLMRGKTNRRLSNSECDGHGVFTGR